MITTMPGSSAGPARTETAKNRIYRLLKADIVAGVFDMGERLNENQLARHYGVGRTPVREALGMLQQAGLVEAVPRVGYLTSQFTMKDVENLFALRKILESAAAEEAAVRITEEELRRLDQLEWHYDAGDRGSYLSFLEQNMQFHCSIARASGNEMLVDIVAHLLEQMQRLIILRLDIIRDLEELVDEHRELLVALRQRDPSKARAHMIADITNSHQNALEALRRLMATRRI